MTHRAIVLGCGLVGTTMARELAADDDFDVTVAEVNPQRLDAVASQRVTPRICDLSDVGVVRDLVEPFDVVLGSLPSALGFQTLRAVVEAGVPYSDISFMPEDALALDALARQKGAIAVVDCGVSPGLSNLVIGHAEATLDEVERATIYVGGLPRGRTLPFQYKAPFAPRDVIEEYTRPARLIEHGQLVTRPALSEVELVDFPGIGTLEAFNTDGLRSLLKTTRIPNLREKTLRYPGHAELMRAFRDAGLFSKELIDVGSARVRPLDVTAQLLFPRWTYLEGEEEFTVLRIRLEGAQSGRRVRQTYELFDEYHGPTATSSMARTTAFPNVIVAKLLARGQIKGPGIFPPERLATNPGLFDHVLGELARRGVRLTSRVEPR